MNVANAIRAGLLLIIIGATLGARSERRRHEDELIDTYGEGYTDGHRSGRDEERSTVKKALQASGTLPASGIKMPMRGATEAIRRHFADPVFGLRLAADIKAAQ